ncbi:SLC19A2_3 [Acanthosepion pharaonis]|uniref:SLC19A2_3 n=1 Tax=Acanthosepion pharaonis TaxID=158019 RepID=A0A812DUC4_ACAPH|nr:SLC19A2_3 [Sepia pharaonis]
MLKKQNLFLYEVIRVDHNSAYNYNAAVDATSLAICAAASFGIGFVTVDWSKYGELLLFFVNMVIGGLMVWMSFTDNIWVAYVCYLIIRIIFQTVLTIATYQVAVHLSSRCYGLVFGLNTFLALILETIMTVIVVDKHGLNLDVRTQFVVYGGYFGFLALPREKSFPVQKATPSTCFSHPSTAVPSDKHIRLATPPVLLPRKLLKCPPPKTKDSEGQHRT